MSSAISPVWTEEANQLAGLKLETDRLHRQHFDVLPPHKGA
jgi:hypothetical protein